MSDYSELALYLIEHYNEASPESAAGRALLKLEARVAELEEERDGLLETLANVNDYMKEAIAKEGE